MAGRRTWEQTEDVWDYDDDQSLEDTLDEIDLKAEKVKVSAGDPAEEYLEDKIQAGSGVNVNKVTDSGGGEALEIVGLAGTDEKAGVSANDTTPGYLLDKLTAGFKINLTEVNDGGDEDLKISQRRWPSWFGV